MKQTIFIFILLFIGLTVSAQSGQGYIEYEKAIQALPEYQTAQSMLDLKSKKFQDSLNTMVVAYHRFLQQEAPRNVKSYSTTIDSLNNNLRAMEKRIDDYERYVENQMIKEQNAVELELKECIFQELYTFCKNNNITMLVDKEAVVYCSNCLDYTDKFVEYLKKSK